MLVGASEHFETLGGGKVKSYARFSAYMKAGETPKPKGIDTENKI